MAHFNTVSDEELAAIINDKDLSNTMTDIQVNAIGISSGATALAANMLGYKTGFNNCFLRSFFL